MTNEQADNIVRWIQESYPDGGGFTVVEDYSGRNMYGETTTAIAFDVSLAT